MSGGIYLIRNDEQLVEMSQRAYDSEDLLQGLLAKYPNLLAGNQMNNAPNHQADEIRAEARDEEGQGTHEVRPDEAAHREAKTA